ncbi:hypothetical protein V8C86DRAFT_1831870 [Haematococcus lacustris]
MTVQPSHGRPHMGAGASTAWEAVVYPVVSLWPCALDLSDVPDRFLTRQSGAAMLGCALASWGVGGHHPTGVHIRFECFWNALQIAEGLRALT